MILKFKLATIFLFMLAINSILFAQDQPNIFLSNHTYSSKNNQIGILSLPSAVTTFRLSGENAKIFKLQKNKLFIRKKYVSSGTKGYDLGLEAETTNGKIAENYRIVRDDFYQNKVIAHRGAWKNTGATENSIAALQHAIRLGCHGSEFDVHMTSDSGLIINHDPTFNGKVIHETKFDELKQLKLSNGESLPDLRQFLLEGMKQNSTKLILEIKPTITKERAIHSARKVYEMVKLLKAQAWIDYISFDYSICLELMRLDPYARVAYLNGDKTPEVLSIDKFWGLDYNQNVFQKNPSWIKEAKLNGLTTNVWTVNEPKFFEWFLEQKIDFITTNEPELLLKIVNK